MFTMIIIIFFFFGWWEIISLMFVHQWLFVLCSSFCDISFQFAGVCDQNEGETLS